MDIGNAEQTAADARLRRVVVVFILFMILSVCGVKAFIEVFAPLLRLIHIGFLLVLYLHVVGVFWFLLRQFRAAVP